ncbi:MAG: hypothetical protein NTY70_11680, partial [Burkholderiales bacterium]|nr:hypothetical protein [Burkholderiales bacterium]
MLEIYQLHGCLHVKKSQFIVKWRHLFSGDKCLQVCKSTGENISFARARCDACGHDFLVAFSCNAHHA